MIAHLGTFVATPKKKPLCQLRPTVSQSEEVKSMRLRIRVLLLVIGLPFGCQLSDGWDFSGDDESRLLFFPDVLADPISVESKSDTDVVAVMKADKLHLSEVEIDRKKYWKARIAGFETGQEKGGPEVPRVTVVVKVPNNADIGYRILEQRRNDGMILDGDLSFESRLSVHGGEEVYATRDDAAYSKEYGTSPVEIEEVSYSANEKVAVIKFMPLYYSGPRKFVQLTNHLKVHFYFQYSAQAGSSYAPVSGDGPGPLSNFHINKKSDSSDYSVVKNSQPIDLIIAAEKHRSTLARYIRFKQSIGRKVIDVYVNNKSASQVKEIIASSYRVATPPSTTMLVGHIGDIPSFRGSGDNTWSDWNYSLLDQGSQPDVALGRVPAHNAEELNIFIDKVIARETAARNVDQILLTSGKDQGMRCADNASEVGRAIASQNNRINMTHESKLRGASQQSVIEAYNSNPNFIVYDGHGYQKGMSEIPLLIRDLDKLRNQSYPIILDIACLNANWSGGANSRNFAESILFSRTGGAAGILASGGSGYGHNFFRDIGKVMSAARSAKGTRANEIGHVILTAKAKTGSMQDKSYWNYYGDPASSVWESNSLPQSDSAPSGIRVKLEKVDAGRSYLLASASNQSDRMSYCFGDQSQCSNAVSYRPMAKVRDVNGVTIFRTQEPIVLSHMMRITFAADSQSGSLNRTITIKKK